MKVTGGLLALLVVLSVCSREAHITKSLSPVVIIPGDGSCVLEARLQHSRASQKHAYCHANTGWYRLWLNIEQLTEPWINCWSQNIMLDYNSSTKKYSNAPGVETRVPGWGTLEGLNLDPSIPLQLSNPWEKLIRRLKTAGYIEGKSLRSAPYDFRYTITNAYIKKLQVLIEDTYVLNGRVAVSLVSHSMGCLYSLSFLNSMAQKWKDKYIKQWIPLAGVFGGSTNEIQLFASGNSEGISFVNPLSIREEQRSYQSNFWLLPSPDVFKDRVIAVTHRRNYTAQDYKEFFTDIAFPIGYEQFEAVRHLTAGLTFPKVKVIHFYGMHVKTPSQMTWKNGNFDKVPHVKYEMDGDGTVNGVSLRAAQLHWGGEDMFSFKQFTGYSHVGLLSAPDMLRNLVRLVLGSHEDQQMETT